MGGVWLAVRAIELLRFGGLGIRGGGCGCLLEKFYIYA